MDVLMPQLGETVTEGTVSVWHKKVGDRVTADDILLDIETDKVSMEVPAPGSGTLAEILVETGETVDVGTLLAVVLGEGESASPGRGARESDVSDSAAETPGPQTAPAPEVPPVEVAPAAAEFGDVSPSSASVRGNQMRLSPAVRRLAAEHELELGVIDGSGRNGRITRRDVIDYLSRQDSATPRAAAPEPAAAQPAPLRAVPPSPSPAAAPSPSPTMEPAPPMAGKTVPFDRIRKRTAEHMVRSKATSPHVLQAVEVDFSGVDRVRAALRESWKAQRGYSLTYLPFIAHAVCRALSEFPHVNASVVDESLVVHEHVNLAIAVDLGPGGLVAPVIRQAERASLSELAQSINDIAQRARDQRLKPDDLSGGTYTLSNSGTFGTLITAPIINQPQVAILSTDGVRKKPVVVETAAGDAIAIRPIGILAQSFDHRAFDGAYSAAFLDRTRKIIEQSDWFREI